MTGRPTPQEHPPTVGAPLTGTSVWAVAQRAFATQRSGRYVPDSVQHPARMAPDLAAHIIRTYTRPGDLVVDPMCGIGTTLVEAVHAGRLALGLDCEKRWVAIAEHNLDLAGRQGAQTRGDVVHADARTLPEELVAQAGTAALILTSPPYGPNNHYHNRIRSTRETGQRGLMHRRDAYGDPDDEANLANVTPQAMAVGFTEILRASAPLLRGDGYLVVTARPWRENGELVDLPSMVIQAAEAAGFTHIDRNVALLTGLRSDRLIPRPSFLQLTQLRQAWTKGARPHLIAHEDVLVFLAAGLQVFRHGSGPVEILESAPPGDNYHSTPLLSEQFRGEHHE